MDIIRVKKRHKQYLNAFFVGHLGVTIPMVYAIHTRGLEPNFKRLFALPVGVGVLSAAAQMTNVRHRQRRRERKNDRRRSANEKKRGLIIIGLTLLVGGVLFVILW